MYVAYFNNKNDNNYYNNYMNKNVLLISIGYAQYEYYYLFCFFTVLINIYVR